MSTDINNVVAELYRELMQQFTTRMSEVNNRPTRLQRLRRDPLLLLRWPFRRAKRYYEYKTNEFYRTVMDNIATWSDEYSRFNDFTPTSKTFPDVKIAVYTSITGGYDDLRDPVYVDDELDYYVVTDNASVITHRGGGAYMEEPSISGAA